MHSSPDFTPKAVWFDDENFWIKVGDGRTIGVPIAWFPRLVRGTREQRDDFELSRRGIHWDALDEDIRVAALFEGLGDMTRRMPAVA